jgi:hypothetical protein
MKIKYAILIILVAFISVFAGGALAADTVNQGAPAASTQKGWRVQGNDATGKAPTGAPLLMGGSDGSATRTLRTDAAGSLAITGDMVTTTVFVSQPVSAPMLSAPVDASKWKIVSGSAWLGSPTSSSAGNFKIQGSNDTTNNPPAANSWQDISGANVSVASGWNVQGWNVPSTSIAFRWIRGVWQYQGQVEFAFTAVADVGGSLAGKYFLVNNAGVTTTYPFISSYDQADGLGTAVWYRVSGSGASPGVVTFNGRRYVPLAIDIATNDSAASVAAKTANILSGAYHGIVSSTDDGTSWISYASTTALVAGGYATYGNGRWVYIGVNKAAATSDGVNWESSTQGVPAASSVGSAGNASVVVGLGINGTAYYSTDGINYLNAVTGVSAPGACIASNGSRFVVIPGSGTNSAYYSDNPSAWSAATTLQAGKTYSLACGSNGTGFVACPSAVSACSTSANGTSWSTAAGSTTIAPLSLAASPTTYVLMNNSTTANVSTDGGATWGTVSLPFTPPNGGFAVTYDASRGEFVALDSSSTNVWVSTDGISWRGVALPSMNTGLQTSVFASHGRILAWGNGATSNASMVLGSTTPTAVAASAGAIFMLKPNPGAGAVPMSVGTSGFTMTQIMPSPTQRITASITGIY